MAPFDLASAEESPSFEIGQSVAEPPSPRGKPSVGLRRAQIHEIVTSAGPFALGAAIVGAGVLLLGAAEGHALGASLTCLLPTIALVCKSVDNRIVNPGRSFSLDVFRGSVMLHIVTFHFAYDLRMAGLVSTCNSGSWCAALCVTVLGHAVVISVARRATVAAQVLLCILAWILTTGAREKASKIGMCLMMFTSGYTSRMQYETARSAKSHFSREVLHSAQLATGAAAITVSTYVYNPRHFISFGSLHLLALGSVLTSPFVTAPFVAMSFGAALIFCHTENRFQRWKFTGGMDSQPLMLGCACQLLGIFARKYKVLDFLQGVIDHNRQSQALDWMGQRALFVFVGHQVVLIPFVFLLRGVLGSFSAQACSARWLFDSLGI